VKIKPVSIAGFIFVGLRFELRISLEKRLFNPFPFFKKLMPRRAAQADVPAAVDFSVVKKFIRRKFLILVINIFGPN
jgi:hypothetical protein